MKSYEIHISGRVQGVGFRPFIFNLAKEFGLKGYVSNDELGVVIFCQGEQSQLFFKAIHDRKPVASEIVFSEIKECFTTEVFEEFFIKPTEKNIVVDIPLTPDFATCSSCEKELFDPNNSRYFYPFTTCTQCGPRYSVTKKFPFERENTAIVDFKMCANCLEEYQNPQDVRFHSQTNSCPNCGIKIELKDNLGNEIEGSNKEIFEKLAQEFHSGKIIAVKNTSGYLLMCDATNPTAVAELRRRKCRPAKPFAVLFPEIQAIENYLKVSKEEAEAFLSPESPIVICDIKERRDLALEQICPNMNSIGAMFPYSGMLKLVSKTFGKPLIATSGNVHGSPICTTKEQAEKFLKPIADFFLHHSLDIQHAQDDSVIKFSSKYKQKIVFRRSRGFAPNYFFAEELSQLNGDKNKILALGGDLKNTFVVVPNNHIYISEYVGDLANYDTFERFESTVKSYQEIFNFYPEIILKDQHPRYENQKIITNYPKANISEIQHHEAHFAAILGERKLWDRQNVLGIVWDGIGYGNEKEIWGGEVFSYENRTISRISKLENFPWILGDKMSKSPKISALCILGMHDDLKEYFEEQTWKIYTQFIEQSQIKTSSMGRFFDAAAFVLGYDKEISFEGEAAMWLEKIAQEKFSSGSYKLEDYLRGDFSQNLLVKNLLNKVLEEKKSGIDISQIALNLHYTLVNYIKKIAEKYRKTKNLVSLDLAFSGGVWQNALLVDLAIEVLKPNFTLHFHEKLSPNDENISFGQLNYYLNILV